MVQPLRIALAADSSEHLLELAGLVSHMGHEVVAVAMSGTGLVEHCRVAHPDMVISEVGLPGLDGLVAAEEINRERDVPVVIVSPSDNDELLDRAGSGPVVAYLVTPVREADLKAAIAVALPRFARLQALVREADALRHDLEDHEQAQRARKSLMRQLHVTEDQVVRAAEAVISRIRRI